MTSVPRRVFLLTAQTQPTRLWFALQFLVPVIDERESHAAQLYAMQDKTTLDTEKALM